MNFEGIEIRPLSARSCLPPSLPTLCCRSSWKFEEMEKAVQTENMAEAMQKPCRSHAEAMQQIKIRFRMQKLWFLRTTS